MRSELDPETRFTCFNLSIFRFLLLVANMISFHIRSISFSSSDDDPQPASLRNPRIPIFVQVVQARQVVQCLRGLDLGWTAFLGKPGNDLPSNSPRVNHFFHYGVLLRGKVDCFWLRSSPLPSEHAFYQINKSQKKKKRRNTNETGHGPPFLICIKTVVVGPDRRLRSPTSFSQSFFTSDLRLLFSVSPFILANCDFLFPFTHHCYSICLASHHTETTSRQDEGRISHPRGHVCLHGHVSLCMLIILRSFV